MGATSLFISILVHGVRRLRLTPSFCKTECGLRRTCMTPEASEFRLILDRRPQGSRRNVVRWVHCSSFLIRPPAALIAARYGPNCTRIPPQRTPIPQTDLFIDPGWYGTVLSWSRPRARMKAWLTYRNIVVLAFSHPGLRMSFKSWEFEAERREESIQAFEREEVGSAIFSCCITSLTLFASMLVIQARSGCVPLESRSG
jgi:hypothetical protein